MPVARRSKTVQKESKARRRLDASDADDDGLHNALIESARSHEQEQQHADEELQRALVESARIEAEQQQLTKGLCNLSEEQKTQLLNDRLKPMGLQAGRSRGDGSCLLHALIDQYRQHCWGRACSVSLDSVRSLRAELVQYMMNHPPDPGFVSDEDSWEVICNETAQPTFWLGERHFPYLADMLNVQITVVPTVAPAEGHYSQMTYGQSPTRPRLVVGWFNEQHYVTTLPETSTYEPGPRR